MVKKTVIITGASGDIGKAIAYKFAENNYNLALCSNKNNVEYDDELKEKFKIEVKNYKMDISDYAQVENVFNKIFEFIVLNVCFCRKSRNKRCPNNYIRNISPKLI